MNKLLADHLTSSLYTYVEDAMGYTLFEQPHREMTDYYESALPPPPDQMKNCEQRYTMYLAPRETLKTSCAQGLAEYFVLKWKHLYGYDARVLIVRASREASQSVLAAVREDFEKPIITRAFGPLTQDAPLWAKEAVTLPWRTTSYREPTIDTGATGVSKTGYHFDLAIVDDLANETNYMSDVEMHNARRYIMALFPVLNTWGTMLVIGTRWGHNDPYGWILNRNMLAEAKNEAPPWNVRIESCRNKDGTLFYPEYLTEKSLAQKKSVLDDKQFAANYLNVVIADEAQVFKKTEQRFYDGIFMPRTEMDIGRLTITEGAYAGSQLPVTCTMHIDPQTSVTQTANYTGINIVLTDPSRNYWVHQSLKTRILPADTISTVLTLARAYSPESITIDVLGQQVLWVGILRTALDEAGFRDINIVNFTGKGKVGQGLLSKSRRIEALQIPLREGKMFFHQGECLPVLHEMDTYDGVTPTNHFDCLDSLSHCLTTGRAPKPQTYADNLEKREMDEDKEDAPKERVMVRGIRTGYSR